MLMGNTIEEIEIILKSTQIGEFGNVRIPFYIQDIFEPKFVNISGLVKDVSVLYYVSEKRYIFSLKAY